MKKTCYKESKDESKEWTPCLQCEVNAKALNRRKSLGRSKGIKHG